MMNLHYSLKILKKFLKKVGKSSKPGSSFPKTFKGKNSSKNSNFSNNKKRIQCKECKRYGHIQSECANTRKNKSKAKKSTWSDEESDGSQEVDDMVSNLVAFSGNFVSSNRLFMNEHSGSIATDTVCLSVKSDSVVIESKVATSGSCDSDSDSGNEFEKDDESLQES